MKTIRITYWTTTILISAMMLSSGIMYFTAAQVKEGFIHLGYPDYFRVELGIAKLLGVAALLLPAARGRIKEWAYFGFFITFVSALIAHISSGDPASKWAGVFVAMALLISSYLSYQKLEQGRAQ
jgi:hypothetical protein